MSESKTKTIRNIFAEFVQAETSSGIILLSAALVAFILANSPVKEYYHTFWQIKLGLSLLHWINDGLMAIFFFLVGLEIKRELLQGELSSLKKATLPLMAAFGGMILPALIYLFFNAGSAAAAGWGIPMATDIAFSLGILALLGKSVPLGLKVFLTAFAIADDLGAVLVIAFFYTSELSFAALASGMLLVACLFMLNVLKVTRGIPYVILSIGVWVAFLLSGVHATVAGVLAALTIPLRQSTKTEEEALLQKWEHKLQPYVAFGVMPLFAFANSGVTMEGNFIHALFHPVTLGIVVGLVFGKLGGLFLFSRISVFLGLSSLPEGVRWKEVAGVSLLGGIGFTMSLFIATLAFGNEEELLRHAKIGILVASLIAGSFGWLYLKIITKTQVGENHKP